MTAVSQQSDRKKGQRNTRSGPTDLALLTFFEIQLADKRSSCVLNGEGYGSWQAHSRQRSFQNDNQVCNNLGKVGLTSALKGAVSLGPLCPNGDSV